MKRQVIQLVCATSLALASLHSAAAAEAAAGTAAKADFSACKPEWPKEALRNEQSGRVTLSFRIGADGLVQESIVKQSSGFPLLDEAARTGLMRCKFKPAVADGQPIASWVSMQYVWTLDEKIDPVATQVFEAMRARAEQGEVAAQRELGALYATGRGVKRDNEQALAWMTKAANAGDAEAQYRAGSAHQGGYGTAVDMLQAAEWYRKAAEQGHPQAQVLLGSLYMMGRGVPRDDAQAADWLRKAVAQNHGPAFVMLAGLTRNGRGGIAADPTETRRLLRQGAALDDRQAQFYLGAELLTNGTALEKADGVQWLLKAAPLGSPQLQVMLGLAYRDGNGIARDYAQARAWLGKAAAQSWPQAQYALAVLTEQGMGGPRNEAEALALYQKAAARGIPEAALRLADASAQGELGHPVDAAKADEWRQRAAAMERNKGR